MTPYKGQSKINSESERLLPENKINVNLLSRFSGHKLLISFLNAVSMKTRVLDFLITFMPHGNVLAKILFIHAQGRASRTITSYLIKKGWFTGPWNFSRVYNECTNYTEDQSCKFSYETVISECPSKFFIKIVLFLIPEVKEF